MKRFFNIYQYLAVLILFPLAYILWYNRLAEDHGLTILLMSIPIIFSYVVPGIGTNVLKIWEFDTRWKLGRFRFYHGFVFGSATSLITALTLPMGSDQIGFGEMLQAGFIMGSVLAFWNWLYDLLAIKAGFLMVYNRAWSEGRGPEVISLHYAPAIFGCFGFFFGISVRVVESLGSGAPGLTNYGVILVIINVLNIGLSVGAYALISLLTIGETGFTSYEKKSRSVSG